MTGRAVAPAAFVVAPAGRRAWRVTHVGAKDSVLFRARPDAVQFAHLSAQGERPSIVRVLTPEASIEGEWRYEMQTDMRIADDFPEASPPRPRRSAVELRVVPEDPPLVERDAPLRP